LRAETGISACTRKKTPAHTQRGRKSGTLVVSSPPLRERLDSWKEIAAYLGRDVRTVRRWEEEKGLPVHRVPGGERRAVFAYRSEIDAWLHRSEEILSQAATAESNVTNHADEAAEVVRTTASRLSKPILTVHRAVLVFVVLLLPAIVALRFILERVQAENRVDSVVFSGNSIQARNSAGNLLWTYSVGKQLSQKDLEPERIQLVDLFGDGQKQVVVVPPLHSSSPSDSTSDALLAISSRGKFLWRFDFNQNFQFSGKFAGPPWFFGGLLVTNEGGDLSIWCAVDSSYDSPSVLVQLNREGKLRGSFVNWGHIHVLGGSRSGGNSYILAGGINNECNCAMLAVLREDAPSGSSPGLPAADGMPEFQCSNCAAGRPYRYLLFPRSELAEAMDVTYNQVGALDVSPERIRVRVKETYSPEPIGADWEGYQFSSDFVPQSVSESDHLPILHRQLEAEGKIKHTLERCPELGHPRTVRMWSAQKGWENISVKPI